MGKGKSGCGQDAMSIGADQIEALVRGGQTQEALEIITQQADQGKARGDLIKLAESEKDPDQASRYRHLLAALNHQSGTDAVGELRRDINNPKTSEKFRRLAQKKIDAIVNYRPRIKGDLDDISEIMDARKEARSATLTYQNPETEIGMLNQAFGPDQVYYFPSRGGIYAPDLIGRGTSTGIGYRFDKGPLLQAVDKGTIFVMHGDAMIDAPMKTALEELISSGTLTRPEDRQTHQAAPGFMIVMLEEAGDGEPIYKTEKTLDFTDWPAES